MKNSFRPLLLSFVLLATSCLSVTTVNIGTKSSLERQLIGELEPLSEEEVLAASVRASSTTGIGSLEELQARALAARRRQLFNKDDVDELKKLACLGEDKDALLIARSCAQAGDAETGARLTKLVSEENEDRAAIVDWAVAADPALTPADRPEILHMYARLLRERAAAGTWVQEDDGTWKQR